MSHKSISASRAQRFILTPHSHTATPSHSHTAEPHPTQPNSTTQTPRPKPFWFKLESVIQTTFHLQRQKAIIERYAIQRQVMNLGVLVLLVSAASALKGFSDCVTAPCAVKQAQPGQISVLCVGDSITAGLGASSSSTTYPSVLQLLLGDHFV